MFLIPRTRDKGFFSFIGQRSGKDVDRIEVTDDLTMN